MIYLLVAFVALQIADGVTTALALAKGGRELNPVVAWGMGKIGVIPALLAYKAVGIAAGVLLFNLADDGGSYMLAFLTALYAWVVVNNYKVYRRLQETDRG